MGRYLKISMIGIPGEPKIGTIIEVKVRQENEGR